MKTTILQLLFFSHFLADYTHLSTNWMLAAKRLGKPLFPIFCHALMHAVLMGVTMRFFGVELILLLYLSLFQLITHFLIDVKKGRMNGWFPLLQNPDNKWHWIVFGADQFLHALVIIIMFNYI